MKFIPSIAIDRTVTILVLRTNFIILLTECSVDVRSRKRSSRIFQELISLVIDLSVRCVYLILVHVFATSDKFEISLTP